MRTLRTIAEVRTALSPSRREGRAIGLVPTMGAFHGGHLSLMRRARADCDEVVVSLFVNPAQFNEQADLLAYPRDESRDALLAAEAGVDLLFAPSQDEVYPDGFATTVSVAGLTDELEGEFRGRGHFDGVTTVVTKLLNIVAPDVAYFGQKDAQQAQVIRRLVRDLNLPVRIEVCPTIREPDGLAMSSRNVQLSGPERDRAAALHRALERALTLVAEGETGASVVEAAMRDQLALEGVEIEYAQVVGAESFKPLIVIDGPAIGVIAARVGGTRLIDNQLLRSR
jgi:pantoate--beta-alanine ligase